MTESETLEMQTRDGEIYRVKRLHALRGRATVDVYAAGFPDADPPVDPAPGALVVDYLPTALTNRAIAEQFESVQEQLAGDNANAILELTDTLKEVLTRIVWAWNAELGPVSERTLLELGPVIMTDIMMAIVQDVRAKNGSGDNSTTGSLPTPLRSRGRKATR